MTITPVPVRPAAAATPGARGERPSDPAGFAALVSREADRLAGGCCDGAPASDAAGSGGPDGGTADASAGDVPAGAALPGVVLPDPAAATVPGGNHDAGAEADQDATGEQGDVVSAGPHGPQPDAGGALAAIAVGALADEAAVSDTGGAMASNGNGASEPRPPTGGGALPVAVDSALDAAADGPVATGNGPEDGAPTTSAGASTSTAGTTTGAGPDATAVPGVTGSTGVAGAEAAGDATPTQQTGRTTAALLDQVSPTLTRLVSRGDGEHRMTLKIHPADLGEVHLTVTVRGERVDVDIAASAEARELLRDGLTQLRGLLDPTGRGGGQLVFRDLPTPPPGQPVSAEAGTGGDQGARSGSADADGSAEGHDGRGPHASPQAARTASPGPADVRPAAPPPRPAGPGTRTVDLTI